MAKDKQAALFEKYLSAQSILIVDTASSARTGLAKTLIGMGAKPNMVRMANSYEVALEEIAKNRPKVVISDFTLGPRCGLDLIHCQQEQNKDAKDLLFILVTGDTSQSTVAQAAEEDVDTFVLKPYTLEVLRSSIMKAALAKLYPSDYRKTVDAGKKLMDEGKLDEAIKTFEDAKKMDPKPSLACFYLGQAEMIKELMELAKGSYSEGLNHNKIHYKCLTGLFDLLQGQKSHKEAYDVAKRISRYFPANPKRLSEVLRLAVTTQSFEDIERYYQIFTKIEARNDQLIKYVCAALVVCAKFYLSRNFKSRALELYEKAGITAAGNTNILREIIVTLLSFDLAKEAEKFLTRFPAASQASNEYKSLEYLVTDRSVAATISIEKGRKLLQSGIEDPQIYRVLINRSKEAGLKDYAEQLARTAGGKFADKKDEFLAAAGIKAS